jgi:hypothetical protein
MLLSKKFLQENSICISYLPTYIVSLALIFWYAINCTIVERVRLLYLSIYLSIYLFMLERLLSIESLPTFRRKILPTSSMSKNKPSKKPAWKQVARRALFWFLAPLILRDWWWRRYDPPKRRLTFNRLHGVISQDAALHVLYGVCKPIYWPSGLKEPCCACPIQQRSGHARKELHQVNRCAFTVLLILVGAPAWRTVQYSPLEGIPEIRDRFRGKREKFCKL